MAKSKNTNTTVEKTPSEPKARKSRAKKVTPVPAPALNPEKVEVAPIAIIERLDATMPLTQIDFNETRPLDSKVVATYTAQAVAEINSQKPMRVSCQQVEAAYLSDVGMLRKNNEDSASVFLGTVPRLEGGAEQMLFGFLGVADGMGGHENGEVASNIAIRTMLEGAVKEFYMPAIAGLPPGLAGETPADVMRSLVESANQNIIQDGQQRRANMGTTLSCAVVLGQTAFVGHVGDSRVYVLEKSSNQLYQVTHDHSLVQRLVDLGQLSAEDALNSPQRSVLYMSLGQKARVEADVEIVPLSNVNYMMICSDGLWDMIEDYQIEHILKTAVGPAEASAALVAAANEAGGADNITVVVAKF